MHFTMEINSLRKMGELKAQMNTFLPSSLLHFGNLIHEISWGKMEQSYMGENFWSITSETKWAVVKLKN